MNKKVLLTICMICPVWAWAQFSGNGSGKAEDPYQITTADELFEVRNALSASYKLMNDIDLTEWIQENSPSQGWSPIGTFSGTFDGNGKTIKGLFIKRPTTDYVGLFGQLSYTGKVENLCIDKPVITGKDYVGVVAGFSNGSIGNGDIKCVNIHSVCVVEPTIQGQKYVGSMTGYGERTSLLENSVILPMIDATSCVGGIIGYHIAYNAPDFQIYGYVNNNVVCGGTIFGQTEVGGIIGYSTGSSNWTVKNDYCSAALVGNEYVGGICGKVDATEFEGYIYNGTSNPAHYVNRCRYAISNNHFAGSIMAEQAAGGIVGGLYCHYSIGDRKFVTYKTFTTKVNINLYDNLCSGNVSCNENTSGILGKIPTTIFGSDQNRQISGYGTNVLQHNVFCGDSLIAKYTNSHVYRISSHDGTDNYALSTASLVIDNQPFIVEEDNAQQGTSLGKKTLMKQSTYGGIGFDFTNNWAIIEGETYPYNIAQCRPAVVTDFKGGKSATISGTAIGKSSQCNGRVFVSIGSTCYDGVVTNGLWTVELGDINEEAKAKVIVMVDDMLPSISTIAKAEKGSGTPADDDTSGKPLRGDVNEDGMVDVEDVVEVVNIILGIGDTNSPEMQARTRAILKASGFNVGK